MDVRLTPDQIEQFHTEGYLVLDRITSDEELERLRAIYDRIFAEKIGWEDGAQFDLGGNENDGRPVLPQILGPSRYFPELNDTWFKKNVDAIGLQLYPDLDLQAGGEHMIYKPAAYGKVTPWHQDQAYHSPTKTFRGVNFWMPLDDATEENGCLYFVPGSHKLDVLPHHSIDNDPRIHGLEVDHPERWHAQSIAAPVPAGGATLHAAYMLHYAPPNTSARPRRAYIRTVRPEPTLRSVPVDNYWMHDKRTQAMERRRKAAHTATN